MQPIFCGYAGCYCLMPAQIEGACEDCDLKEKYNTSLHSSDFCPNGLGTCTEKNCPDCSRFLYAIFRGD